MEKDIDEHLSVAVDTIYEYCKDLTESGNYLIEYEHEDLAGYIEIRYEVRWKEDIGATMYGDCERLVYKTYEQIEVKSCNCLDENGEPYDCGFNANDIQNWL